MAALRSPRHERFAQELAIGKSADEAYQLAGYKLDRAHASRLAANGNIQGRVQELLQQAADTALVTVDSLVREAHDIQLKATASGQYSAAIAALIAKAKLTGRWVERSEQRNTNTNYAVSDEPPSEEEWVKKHVTQH